jgi:hypothetical protein
MIGKQFDVEMTRNGTVFDQRQSDALMQGLPGAPGLLVLAHGWDNDIPQARKRYDEWTTGLDPLTEGVAVMRVFWPSKRFADADLLPGGGAASASTANDDALQHALEGLKQNPERLGERHEDPVRAASVDRALALVDDLPGSADARREFVLCIRAVLNPDDAHRDDGSEAFFAADPEDLFDRLSPAVVVEPVAGRGGAATVSRGGAAGFLGDRLSGIRAAARRIGNFATYYQMKTRAGVVGEKGVATTLTRIRERHPGLPVHLVGHSFGARLVTAAASALAPGGAPVTATLLQGAFSHHGLAAKFDGRHDGAYRKVLAEQRISGPIIVTHTRNDTNVGVAYPLASRLSGDNAAAVGDSGDPYGGMGRNGAQHTPEVDDAESVLHPASPDVKYEFARGRVYNLNADRTIPDHGAVTGEAVVRVIAALLR